jgi:hypothetical protein
MDQVNRAGQLSKPDWVMVGVPVDNGRKRLYASRSLHNADWFISHPLRMGPAIWHLNADLDQLLIITEDSYEACIARLTQIWAAQDRNPAIEQAYQQRARRPQIEAGMSGYPALRRNGGDKVPRGGGAGRAPGRQGGKGPAKGFGGTGGNAGKKPTDKKHPKPPKDR